MEHVIECMVDVETLDVRPSATVLSIGAVAFHQTNDTILEDWSFYRHLQINEQVSAGATVDDETLRWWLMQGDEARHEVAYAPTTDLYDAMCEFTQWYKKAGCQRVWGHGSNFDIPIVENLLRMNWLQFPWYRKVVRDTRTLFELADFDFKAFQTTAGGIHHHPVDDARVQAKGVIAAREKLYGAR